MSHLAIKKSEYITRLITIALRGITLASKFLLILFLAGFLEPQELGLYGLLTVTISYAIYPLGFDFYIFSTREFLKNKHQNWGALLRDQGVLHLILYILVLPFLALLFAQGFLPWALVSCFFILLVTEHLNQEIIRLLIAVSEQLTASYVLFLRSGAWALSITIWMFIDPAMRSLDTVLAAWVAGSGAALSLAFYRLYKLKMINWSQKINWRWIVTGLKVAIPFFVATLALRAVFTLDRYWFEALQGLEMLGAYVLFMGIANALVSFLDAGVFSFSYPSLIAAYNQQDKLAFRNGLKRMLLHTIIIIVGFSAVSLIAIEPILNVLGKPFYIEQLFLFPWLLTAMALYAISMIPHYGLYAQGYDKPIIFSHLFALVIFVTSTWGFSIIIPEKAVLLGLITSSTCLFLWKACAFYCLTPNNYRLAISAETYN